MTTLRLIVSFDGTGNTPKDKTNVFILHDSISNVDLNGIVQKKTYINGVGTEFGERFRGGVFGKGVSQKIMEGYQWLVDNYIDGAEIYVFGFSRGAFTARSLVQMLNSCGLMRIETKEHISFEQMFRRYENITTQKSEVTLPIYRLRYFDKYPEQVKPHNWLQNSHDVLFLKDDTIVKVDVKMAGLWDTVGSLGLTMLTNVDDELEKASSHNVRLPKMLKNAYHAMAIDENRSEFEITLWRKFFPDDDYRQNRHLDLAKNYEQRWFVGAHTDIGGGIDGYKGENKLSTLPLAWMLEKSNNHNLYFNSAPKLIVEAHKEDIFDSYTRTIAGKVAALAKEWLPGSQRNYRLIGRPPRKVTTAAGTSGMLCSVNETIDPSVFDRVSKTTNYRPPNLLKYLFNNPSAIPTIQTTAPIYADKDWNETGVLLEKDKTYQLSSITITEPLKDASWESDSIEGKDWQGFWHKLFAKAKRKKDANWFALIGTVDKQNPWTFKVNSKFTAPESGILICYFNDVSNMYWNNSGKVILNIQKMS
jgi:uncharacterized protein (DUF2235 family)